MNVTALHAHVAAPALTSRQLDVVKRTIAADCDHDEFNLYVEVIKRKQLDPFTRQCFPLVFNKNKKDKRKMTIIVSQDGLRALAARTADYRPDENEPVFEYDQSAKGALNPVGVVKVTTTLWKMDTRGVWHPVKGWAYWDELAAVKEEWADIDGKWQPTGRKSLDGNWPRMPRIMIAKCATMNALRAGWPDTYGGLYAEEEMDKARAEMTATEMVEAHQAEQRQQAANIKRDEYPCVGEDGNLLFIPAGRFVDHMLAAVREFRAPEQVDLMASRNREAFTRFWAAHKDDALQLRGELDKRRAQLAAQPAITVQPTANAETAATEPKIETTDSLPLEGTALFLAECRQKIAAFPTEAKLAAWWTSKEFGQQCLGLSQDEIDDLKGCASRRRAEIKAEILGGAG